MIKENFSKIGYVLAVAGSAVGLGNAWKFPYMVGENGGSAFVLLYLLMCFIIALPIFLAELSMGKLSQSDSVNSFRQLSPPKHKKIWQWVGIVAMSTAAIIASYYIVIIGWVLKYMVESFSSLSVLPTSLDVSTNNFSRFLSTDALGQIFYFAIAFFICISILLKGVKNGIEKISMWMMPSLFVMLLIMLLYSMTLDGFSKSLEFLLVPDFSKINTETVFKALGLAFFTMSIGMSIIITYSSSLSEGTNLVKSSISVILINILLGIIIGLTIFALVFQFGAEPSQGPGLIFISLPTLFSQISDIPTFGNLFSGLFFIALAFAGLTSAISIIEPFAFFLIREYNLSRPKALFIVGTGVFVLGILCLFSNIKDIGDSVTFFGKNFFDFLDYLASNILLPLGGIGVSLFVGFAMKKDSLYELFAPYMSNFVFNSWYFILRYVAPILVILIMLNTLEIIKFK